MRNSQLRISDLYQGDSIDISIELFPPKTARGRRTLMDRVKRLRRHDPAYFSMTYGAAGSTQDITLSLVDELKNELGVSTMCHLTIVGHSKDEIERLLDRLEDIGIQNLIALRGDPPHGAEQFRPHDGGYRHAIDLVRAAKRRGTFSIAVAGFPENHPDSPSREFDIRYLKEKVDAGADLIVTQLFFDNSYYFDYLAAVRAAGIDIPVIPGILPIVSVPQVRRFTKLCKSTIPKDVQAELLKYEADDKSAAAYGIDLATRQCDELISAGVPGLHFYSLNRYRSVEAVLDNLGMWDSSIEHIET